MEKSNLQIIEGNTTNFFNEIKKLDRIDKGNSIVYKIKLNSNKIFALKEIILKQEIKENVIHEIKILKLLSELNHEYIIKFYDYCITEDIINSYNTINRVYILMEYAFTNLDKLVYKKSQEMSFFSKNEIVIFLDQMISENKIVHCDVKPENIVVVATNPFCFKICDVGAGGFTSSEKTLTKTRTIKGTVSYMAPELVGDTFTQSCSYNPIKADVFSFGLCLLYLITFQKFHGNEREEINLETLQEILQDLISEAVKIVENDRKIVEILKICLQIPIEKRKDFIEIRGIYEKLKLEEENDIELSSLSNSFEEEDQKNKANKFKRELVKSKTKELSDNSSDSNDNSPLKDFLKKN